MKNQKHRLIPPLTRFSTMNRLETRYADFLELRKRAGEILDYRFEPMRLILSHNVPGKRNAVTYLPDFLVIYADHMEFVEIKAKRGKWTSMKDDARAKLNIASETFSWFKFTALYYENGVWTEEHLN